MTHPNGAVRRDVAHMISEGRRRRGGPSPREGTIRARRAARETPDLSNIPPCAAPSPRDTVREPLHSFPALHRPRSCQFAPDEKPRLRCDATSPMRDAADAGLTRTITHTITTPRARPRTCRRRGGGDEFFFLLFLFYFFFFDPARDGNGNYIYKIKWE